MASQIKWKQSDFMQLGKAVKEFNRKINRLQVENIDYLPDTIEYQDLRDSITTRNELKRVLNSLKRFKKEGAEDLYTTASGEQLTNWERGELRIQSAIATRRLKKELVNLNLPKENGFSRVQMGSERARKIEAQIDNMKGLEKLRGYEFEKAKDRIKKWGTSDYEMKKAIIYRENYMNTLKKYSHLDNYDELIKKLDKYKNPIEFYNLMSKNELTVDLTYQSDQFFTQEAFNSFVEDIGINIDIDSIVEENTEE